MARRKYRLESAAELIIDIAMNAHGLVSKIVSGGQTGADQGALDAALAMQIPCGGICPKGRKSETGKIPDHYPLSESTSSSYLRRTEDNIINSHATLIFTYGTPLGGSRRTIDFAKKHNRPYLHVDLFEEDQEIIKAIHAWLIGGGLIADWVPVVPSKPVLNVAGSRESKHPGIQLRVKEILISVFEPANYPMGGE